MSDANPGHNDPDILSGRITDADFARPPAAAPSDAETPTEGEPAESAPEGS